MSQPSGNQLLRDKVTIVTGAGGDIGCAIAVRYAQEGARVVVAELQHEHEETITAAVGVPGGDVLGLTIDVSKHSDTEALARQTLERFGRIDVLVNCAAMFGVI